MIEVVEFIILDRECVTSQQESNDWDLLEYEEKLICLHIQKERRRAYVTWHASGLMKLYCFLELQVKDEKITKKKNLIMGNDGELVM